VSIFIDNKLSGCQYYRDGIIVNANPITESINLVGLLILNLKINGTLQQAFTQEEVWLNDILDPISMTPYAYMPLNSIHTHQFPDRICAGCGNGILEPGEQCDDLTQNLNDGCDDFCSIEPGYTCIQNDLGSSICTKCGDGKVIGAEKCDDGSDDGIGCPFGC